MDNTGFISLAAHICRIGPRFNSPFLILSVLNSILCMPGRGRVYYPPNDIFILEPCKKGDIDLHINKVEPILLMHTKTSLTKINTEG